MCVCVCVQVLVCKGEVKVLEAVSLHPFSDGLDDIRQVRFGGAVRNEMKEGMACCHPNGL
jgi:hypothetical protein